MVELLKKISGNVVEAASAEEALSLLNLRQCEIVLADIAVLGLEELPLLKAIKAKNAETEVIVVADANLISYAMDALCQGAYDYLIKPVDDIRLVSAMIRRITDKLSLVAERKKLSFDLKGKNHALNEGYKERVQYSQDVSSLYAAEKELFSGLDLMDVYKRSVVSLSRLVGFHPVILWSFSESDHLLRPEAKNGFDRLALSDLAISLPEKMDCSVSGMISYVEKTFMAMTSVRAAVFQPVFGRGKQHGLLGMFSDSIDVFSSREIEILVRFSSSVGIAIENVRLYEEVGALSIRDGMTGLYNRRHFEEVLGMEGFRSVRYRHPVSLVCIDIDYFKNYNDQLGRLTGDEVLKQIATLLVKRVRVADIVCRYGGDEFTIVLPDTDKKSATSVAEDIRIIIASYPFPKTEMLPAGALTVSIGISDCPSDGESLSDIVKVAEEALSHAKMAGRNRVCCA